MLTSVGLGSGLDINAIVGALVNAEKAPKESSFNRNQAVANAEISALGSLKSAMSDFLDKLKPLTKPETFTGTKVKASTDDFLDVTAKKEVAAGSYSVKVNQLATSHKAGTNTVADPEASVGAGTLKFTVNGKSFEYVTSSATSLQSVADGINEFPDNDSISASVVNGDSGAKLVFTSKKTGTENQINVTATPAVGDTTFAGVFSMSDIEPAKDSIIEVDGVTKTSASNTVDDAITGVTLNLTKADRTETTTITLSQDRDAAKKAIEGFVKEYNKLAKTVNGLSHYDKKRQTAGALQGDAMIRSIQSHMRNAVSSAFTTKDGESRLAEFGITTTRSGTLEINSTGRFGKELDDIIGNDNDLRKLSDFFTKEDTGFAAKMKSVLEVYSKTGGIIDSRDETLDGKVKRIQKEREAFGRQMTSLEDRLRKRFNAMDAVVGNLRSQQQFLESRLASLPGARR
ncbi:MAG: flagellar filament capping protein FliD [Parashewanella sp.]